MKAYVKISEAICKDPECCGGEDRPVAVTLIKEIAEKWKREPDTHIESFELTEKIQQDRFSNIRTYESDPK